MQRTNERPVGEIDYARWRAIESRDGAGCFIFGVKTTGIYRHRDCPARAAKRRNVAAVS